MVKIRNDLTGQKFGRLTVIKQIKDYIQPNGTHKSQWLCQCDCGNQKNIIGGDLKSGNTKSCGCLQKETASISLSNTNKRDNDYNLSGSYGVGYTTNKKEFYFDLEDYDKIKDYCWHINNHGYVISYNNNTKKKVYMHRIVTNCPDNLIPDHIHGKNTRNDNRKSNLRIVTCAENNRNRGLNNNNSSGVTGVTWIKSENKWRAQIGINKKHINLGRFKNFEDAVKARREAENKYFGEFSYNNCNKTNKVIC